ncbi:MAG: aldo/keto reductase [Variovorax sp.]
MKHVSLQGLSGPLDVSRLVLGTDYFGSTIVPGLAFEIIDAYVAAGGNTLDTARCYADWVPGGQGASERTLGAWLRERGARANVLISTKGGHPRFDSMQRGRLSHDEVASDLAQSLETLEVERIDLYWLHRDDESQPVEKVMDMIARIAEGSHVRAFGCSNWRAERIEAANAHAIRQGTAPFCASQLQWSLAHSSAVKQDDETRVVMDDRELARYRHNRIPVVAYTSQAKGYFAKPLAGPGAANDKSLRWFDNPINRARRERLIALAEQSGRSRTAITLGYVLSQGIAAMALIGPRTLAQLHDSMAVADVELSPEDLHQLMGDA